MLDSRKSLPIFRQEWLGCTRCSLGSHREAIGGEIVFGEGTSNGVLLIGEGPGKEEEKKGRPFIGRSGQLLRKILSKLGMVDFYITNTVLCRSTEPVVDNMGNPLFSTFGDGPPQPRFKDKAPQQENLDACKSRLEEEIYLVDPIVIVALGAPAANALRGSKLKITEVRGNIEGISIPGVTESPVITEKKKVWARKADGKIIMPTEPTRVRYLMVPTVHPAYALRKIEDMSDENPFKMLAKDLRLAFDIYNKYMLEVNKVLPAETSSEIPLDAFTDELREEMESDG